MEIGNYLKLIRENRKIKQKYIYPNNHISKISRIENNKTNLDLKELKNLCNILGMSLPEFINLISLENEEDNTMNELKNCIQHPDDKQKKYRFLKKWKYINNLPEKDRSLTESRIFLIAKASLSLFWKEIPRITHTDIALIKNELNSYEFFSEYDYMLLCNTAIYFSFEELDEIIHKVYPISQEKKRTEQAKFYCNLFMINSSVHAIYELEYIRANRYLSLMEKYTDKRKDYFTRLNINFLQSLLKGLNTNNLEDFEEAYTVIKVLKNTGNISIAEKFLDELNNLNKDPKHFKQPDNRVFFAVENLE